jgi:hypothetical protein
VATNAQTRANVQTRSPGSVRARRSFTETKPFFLTSEFMALVLMTVSLFVASAVVDDVDSRLAWILGVSLVGAYILSRGIAKAGSRSRSSDPREDMLNERLSADESPRDRVHA